MSQFSRGNALHNFNNAQWITTSTNWTVPNGCYRVKLSMCGGGANAFMNGGGTNVCSGANGYYSETEEVVTPGQTLTILIGAGGVWTSNLLASLAGGDTSVTNGTWTVKAKGGPGASNSYIQSVIGGQAFGQYGLGGSTVNLTPSGGTSANNGAPGVLKLEW